MIYVIEAGRGGPIKVGFTEDERRFKGRLRHMQTYNAHEIRPLALTAGGRAVEREVHALLHDQHMRGEWFDPREGAAKSLRDAARAHGFDLERWVKGARASLGADAVRPNLTWRRSRKVAFANRLEGGMLVTVPGECAACGEPRRVLKHGPDAGAHVAGSVCGACGHVEPA